MKYIQLFLACVGIAYCVAFGDFSVTERFVKTNSNIYYDNIQYTDNVEFYGVKGLNIQYAGELSTLGDYYEISFDVVNQSGSSVKISNCIYQETDDYIEYRLTYDDGKNVSVGDLLKSGERKRLNYRVLYKKEIQNNDYELDSSFYISYEQFL